MQLPLLNYTSKLYPKTDLSNFGLIACQHLLETSIDLLQELFGKGLIPQNTWVIGKCYSTHGPTLERLKKLGVNVSGDGTSFDPRLEFDLQFEKYISDFTNTALRQLERVDKFIVLDDGGYLLENINRREFDKPVFGIEQTTSGYEKLKDVVLHFPVINVARSVVKLKYESPHIVQTILNELKERVILSRDKRVLVVGQGAIGGNLKTALADLVTVYGCDKDRDICDFEGNFYDKLSDFDIIIGATGTGAISEKDLKRLKEGAQLISVSSSDREFPSAAIRIASGQANGSCHDEYIADGVHLLNGGFPINFTGSKHSLPPEHAQLTRSLLLAGVCESIEASGTGLVNLSNKQEYIVNEYQALTNEESP